MLETPNKVSRAVAAGLDLTTPTQKSNQVLFCESNSLVWDKNQAAEWLAVIACGWFALAD